MAFNTINACRPAHPAVFRPRTGPRRHLTAAVCIVSLLVAAPAVAAAQESGSPNPPGPASVPPVFPPTTLPFPFGEPNEDDDRLLESVEISIRDENELGRMAVEAALADLKRRRLRVLERGRDVEYLRKLVNAIRPAMRNAERYKSIKVYVVDSPQTDAWSFPGGTLMFFRGLIDFAESEAALATIVGHELSHLDHGHQLVHLRRMKLIQQTLAAPQSFTPERFFESGSTLMRLWSRPFRPQDEAAADRDGVDWAYRAGYDPRELAVLFRKLETRDGDQSAALPSFFRTHPYHRDRRDAVLDRYDELQQTEPRGDLYVGRENLRRRIPRSRQEFAE